MNLRFILERFYKSNLTLMSDIAYKPNPTFMSEIFHNSNLRFMSERFDTFILLQVVNIHHLVISGKCLLSLITINKIAYFMKKHIINFDEILF